MRRNFAPYFVGATLGFAGAVVGAALTHLAQRTTVLFAPASDTFYGTEPPTPPAPLALANPYDVLENDGNEFDVLPITDTQIDGIQNCCAVCGCTSPTGKQLASWLMLSRGDGTSAPTLFCNIEHAEVYFFGREA